VVRKKVKPKSKQQRKRKVSKKPIKPESIAKTLLTVKILKGQR